jgi:hypothetical protein
MKTETKSDYLGWVRFSRCCDLTGMTENALREYIKKGDLRESVHWIKRKGRYWIHLGEFNLWVSTGE